MAINLSKGQKIDLTKKDATGNSSGLTKFCVGLNWGAIDRSYSQQVKKGGFLGIGGTMERVTKHFKEAVDLDASCGLFNANGDLVDTVYYRELKSKDFSIIHSGDDREGDMDGDDGLDNEIISVDLKKVHPSVVKIVFFLNSFKKQDFADIPFATIRLYEGTPEKVDKIFANYEITSDSKYKGFVSLILGSLYKHNSEWKFNAIGDPIKAQDLKETLTVITQKYL